MRWKNLKKSQNVERRHGGSGGKNVAMGGGLGALIMALIAIFVFKQDPTQALSNLGGGQTQQTAAKPQTERQKEIDEFVVRILGSTEEVWGKIFQQAGSRYRQPSLINYDGSTPMSSGGIADSRMGPFYVPSEEKIYIDTAFFDQMDRDLGGGGDFAYAYVIAHEVGHHIQKLTGRTDYVHGQKRSLSPEAYNRLSVRLELQADFYAGVWAHHANKAHRAKHGTNLLDEGDIEEAMRSARAIGDDALQRQAGQRVRPETFNHGTSKQRIKWFLKGIKTGDVNQRDTFNIDYRDL